MLRRVGGETSSPESGEAPTRITSAVPIGRGVLLAGKYEVDRVLGEGGMGIVVAARHVHLNQKVALKFLLPDVAKDPDTVKRFLREAQSASQIRSEHVARVIDVGTLESGAPFMVMEFLEGRDLGALLNESGALQPQQAVDFLLQGMEAIAEAHAAGIIHRDIKPANLFLTRRADGTPFVKVLDFGLSKNIVEDRNQQSLTRSSTGAMGSPLYMAPEQVRSAKAATHQSDVWSLGVVLFELITNDTPFDGENIGALLAAIVADKPKRLREVNPSLPEGLETAVMRCLEKAPQARHADLGALARALSPHASVAGRVSVERIVGALQNSRSSPLEIHTDPNMLAVGTAPSAKARSLWNFSSASDGSTRVRKGAFLFGGLALASVIAGAGSFMALRGLQVAPPPSASMVAPADRAPEPAPAVEPTPSALPAPTPTPDTSGAPAASAVPAASSEPAASGRPSAAAAATYRRPARPPPRPPPRPPATSKPSIDELLKQGRH